jgi:hypothetical protein
VTVLSILLVIAVYAVFIGSFQGGEVTVGVMGSSSVTYSSDNNEAGSWTPTLSVSAAGIAWYSRLEVASGGFSGPVTITWTLQNETGTSTWTDVTGVTTSTSIVLTGSAQTVYATTDGTYSSSNYNWGSNTTTAGTYRVSVSVDST